MAGRSTYIIDPTEVFTMALVLQLICLIFLTLWALGFYKISSMGTKKEKYLFQTKNRAHFFKDRGEQDLLENLGLVSF